MKDNHCLNADSTFLSKLSIDIIDHHFLRCYYTKCFNYLGSPQFLIHTTSLLPNRMSEPLKIKWRTIRAIQGGSIFCSCSSKSLFFVLKHPFSHGALNIGIFSEIVSECSLLFSANSVGSSTPSSSPFQGQVRSTAA